MQQNTNKPIFIVGSPRSGTSILTWCLGHHPNLFPVPESNWLGDFAVNVAVAHQIGAARDYYSILSAMDIPEDELFAAFGCSINDLILSHRTDLERKRYANRIELKLDPRWIKAASTAAGPKTRWVDGTPEYSFHICGLRKLFPQALFVHLVRDVRAVVRSMVKFHTVTGIHLVANEDEAYRYWMRTVSACLMAERAYGPSIVHRIRYSDLIDNPESAIHSLLAFLEEPFTARCLEPLKERINSSNVSPDFKSDDPATDPAIIEKARRLSIQIQETPQPSEGSLAVAAGMEADFQKRAQYIATLDSTYRMDKSRLEAVIRTYQAEQSRLESAIAELQRQFDDLSNGLTQVSRTNR